MATIESKLATLRRKAAKDAVEVVHLLHFAKIGDGLAVPVLREITTTSGWSRLPIPCGEHSHVIPLARWTEVICTYLEGGIEALVAYARLAEEDSLHFAVAVLEELKSPESADA